MQRFSVSPDSPLKGSDYKLCFDFSDLPSSITYATVTVTHFPSQPGDPQSKIIYRPTSGNVGCITLHAPSNAAGVTFEEPHSDDFSTTFS